ncbi:MAG: hypothetical protein WAT71_14485 [Ignavibacteria bacterium]
MKKIFTIVFLNLLIASNFLQSQTPAYIIKAMNFSFPAPNALEFEIRIEHTNSPTVFEYSGGQYFLNVNTAIANGGTLTYKYANDTSDLPVNMRPRNPQISGSQLRLATNIFPSAGNGFIMTNNGSPGTKIVKMRLETTALSLANVPLNLQWRSQLPDPFTKIYSYIGTTNTNVSSGAFFDIDTSGISMTVNAKVAVEGLFRAINNKHIRQDSIKMFLRNSVSPYNLVDSAIALLDSNTLQAFLTFRFIPAGNYYLVMKYKNSIETWSRSGGENIQYGTTYQYDFTDNINKAYGNNLFLKGSKYCLYSGDVDRSGFIDISDMSRIYNDGTNFLTGEVVTDLNGDRFVDIDDLAIADNNVFSFIGMIRP